MNYLRGLSFLFSGVLFLLFSCSPARNGYRRAGRQIEKEVRKSPVFKRAFTGFALMNPETGRSLADVNGDHFFTPASTTKILTLYTCLKVLGDSVPGLQVQKLHNQYLVRGVADPTFLHPSFQAWQHTFDYLKNGPDSISLYPYHWPVKKFGPGWAWDDAPYSFQAERSIFPMYGNVVQLIKGRYDLQINPPFFGTTKYFSRERSPFSPIKDITREECENHWTLPSGYVEEGPRWLPFTTVDKGLLLTDTLKKTVTEIGSYAFEYVPDEWQTIYSTPLDTVMRRMMYQSDNFVAEQMVMVCAGEKFKSLEPDTLIKWVLDSALSALPQRPRWVDGSGLSRYNLISPQDLSTTLLHLWREEPHESLLSFFPKGGVDGTLADWYAGKDGTPYVFAKSGSMSGVTCLSGYVRTRHGKFLIFTFMTNHFVGSSREWKVEMQRILERIHTW